MAGICVICTKLEKKKVVINDKLDEIVRCTCGKYDKDGTQGFYSFNLVLNQSKVIKNIQDNCEDWDDIMKPKQG